ncbi:MAG TPA: hypothetical protein VK081_14755 [Planctomycetota bacterium]|nr:hypothetical protein [Planctomycetota bacterium]
MKVLTDGKPERQVAAAQILAELKPSEPLVVKALASRLGNGEPHLTRYVLEALAAIGTEDATRALLERLRIGGAESEQIALLMSREENATSARYLASVFDDADLELRCRILSIVGRQNGKEAIAVLRKALLSPEPTLADAALRSLHEVVPRLPGDRRAALTEQIKKDVEHKDIREAPLAYGLRALGVLDPIGARAVLLKFAGPRHPAVVRQAALHALVGVDLTPAQAETLLGYLSEQDMTYVVRPAIAVLARVEKWSAGAVTKLKALLETGTDETRVFALQALRHCKTEAVAEVCLHWLQNGGEAFHDAAIEALSANPAALEPLVQAFTREKDVAAARRLGVPLVRLGPHFTPDHVRALTERAARQVSNGEPLGDVTLHVVLSAARDLAMEDFADRALKLRRAKKSPEAHNLLMRVATHAPLSPEAQYQLALCKLVAENGALPRGENSTSGNATMGYFASLVRDGFPLLERLKKEALLQPEHLLRLGAHFAEGVGTERRFGAEVLQFVVAKHPRVKASEQARLVLRAENL